VAWVLGEYAYLSEDYGIEEILEALCSLARTRGGSLSQRRFLVGAIMKLVAQMGTCPPSAAHVIDEYTRSSDVDLQQRCLEFQSLLTNAPHILGQVLPVDASCEDVDVDVDMSFLDGYVMESKQKRGCMNYNPEQFDDDDDDELEGGRPKTTVNFNAYEKPKDISEYKVDLQRMQQQGGGVHPASTGAAYPSAPYGGPAAGPPPNTSLSGAFAGMGGTSQAQPGIGVASMPTGGAGAAGAPAQIAGPSLIVRNVANVWGSKPAAPAFGAPAAGAAPRFGQQAGAHAAAAAAAAKPPAFGNSGSTAGGYGGWNTQASAGSIGAAPAAPEGPRELTEKEKMAAALFGGIGGGGGGAPVTSGATSVAASRAAARRQKQQAAAAPPPAPAPPAPPAAMAFPVTAAAPTPAPVPVPVSPAPEMDLLDMMSFGNVPSAAPALAPPVGNMLAPNPFAEATPAPPPAAPPAPTPVPASAMVDPFAAECLLGGLSDAPLASLASAAGFQYQGQMLAPSSTTTPQFGQIWGTCPITSPASVVASHAKVPHLDGLMTVLEGCGLHKVETIAGTNEGILAGHLGDGDVILVHGKLTPQPGGSNKVDVTVKSKDGAMGRNLAAFISTQLR
jgi:hypothetical protein